MSDDLFDQLGADEGPLEPGRAFRERLWARVEQELDPSAVDAVAVASGEQSRAPQASAPESRRRRSAGALARVRASRKRTVPVAAAFLTVLSMGALAVLGDAPRDDAEQTVEVIEATPSPRQSATHGPGPLGPPAVVGARPTAPSSTARRAPAVPGEVSVPALPPSGPASTRTTSSWLLVYSENPAETANVEVRAVRAGSSAEPTVLAGSPDDDAEPVLSPDGRRLLWTKQSGRPHEVWSANGDGSDPRILPLPACGGAGSDCGYSRPAFAPDGVRIAMTRGLGAAGCSGFDDCDEVVVYDPRDRTLTAVANGTDADWSLRRDEVVYAGHATAAERNAACAPFAAACTGTEIRIVDLSGATPTSRRVGDVAGHMPRFSPDGEWIAFERHLQSAGIRESAVIRRDGTGLRILAGCRHRASWTPDGRLVCPRAVEGGYDVFLLDANDQPTQRLTFTAGAEVDLRVYAL